MSDEQVARAWESARAAGRVFDLSERDFAAAIAFHQQGHDVDAFFAKLRAPELALATAAAAGSPAAITELEQACAGVIARVVRQFAGAGHGEDDLRQTLRTKLFVATPGGPPAIAQYNGLGSLESWVRVIATRLFIDLGRRKDRARELATDPDSLDVIDPRDLALEHVKADYRRGVAAALVTAVRALERGDRHLLRQHLVEGLTIDQLAAVLGIHRATAARRIARARDGLITRARDELRRGLQLDDAALQEVFGLVVSKLEVSMCRLLATPRPS